jgi:hypothetical protein
MLLLKFHASLSASITASLITSALVGMLAETAEIPQQAD